MIALAAIAVLAFFLGFFATFGLLVPENLWRPLILVGVVASTALLVTHPSVWVALPLALNAGLAWACLDIQLGHRPRLDRCCGEEEATRERYRVARG